MGGGAGGMPDFSSLGAGGDDDDGEEASGLESKSGDNDAEDDMPPLESEQDIIKGFIRKSY